MKLFCEDIKTDGGTQARVKLNNIVVSDYAELMKEGAQFPPIDVFHDGSEYWLADGFHRYFAWKSLGNLDIEATVHQGTLRDAQWFAFQANKGRGLSLTAEDRREIVERMLRDEEWGKKTHAEIARHVGVSSMTVGRIARKIFGEEEAKPKTVTRNGAEYTLDTTNIGKKASENKPKEAPVVEAKPEESQEPELHEDDVMSDLKHTINELSEENSQLRDAIALGQWDASEIEKIDVQETLEQLRKENKLLRIELDAVTESRNTFQNRNVELVKQVKALQSKLKKAGIE